MIILNTLKLFWPILGQRKTSLVIFLWKSRTNPVVFLATILFLIAYIRPLEIILAKNTTELVLLFHKNITKLVFLWSNMGKKSIKVLNINDQINKQVNMMDCLYFPGKNNGRCDVPIFAKFDSISVFSMQHFWSSVTINRRRWLWTSNSGIIETHEGI